MRTPFLPMQKGAFSLVEVVLALGIIAFCLLSLLSLLSVGYRSSSESRQVIDASATASILLEMQRSGANAATGIPPDWALPDVPAGMNAVESAAPVLIDTEGRVSATNPSFALSYRMQRVAQDPSLCRIFLRLSTPARSTQPSAQSHYEIVTAIKIP